MGSCDQILRRGETAKMRSTQAVFWISLISLALADDPFMVFHPSALESESSEPVENSIREERDAQYNNLGYAYQPQTPYYQTAQVPQPAAPAYSPHIYIPSTEPTLAPVTYTQATTIAPLPIVKSNSPSLPETVVEVNSEVPDEPVKTFRDLFGFDFAEKTQRESDAVLSYMRTLINNQQAMVFINELVDTNPCISSFEGTIRLLEKATEIAVGSTPEIEALFSSMQKLQSTRNVSALVYGSSNILSQLDVLLPKLQTFTFFTKCRVGSSEGIDSLRDLAQILNRMSLVEDPVLTTPVKKGLLRSAIITEAITNFLARFSKYLAQRDCFESRDLVKDGTDIAAELLDGIAEVFGVLGFLPTAKVIRAYAEFTRSTASSLDGLVAGKMEINCSSGALRDAGDNLRGIGDIIKEVGLESLAVELGVVFRLDLLP